LQLVGKDIRNTHDETEKLRRKDFVKFIYILACFIIFIYI